MSTIDIHTHQLSQAWLQLLQQHGRPHYTVQNEADETCIVYFDQTPLIALPPAMFDIRSHIQAMDQHHVDISILSLTCPNCNWGSANISLQAAQIMNDALEQMHLAYPDRIRWFASLPWQDPALAIVELQRACTHGAVGVIALANIDGVPLTDPRFESIWTAINKRELPVLVHPTAPPGARNMDLHDLPLVSAVGFPFDTTLAMSRMIRSSFFERYQKLKIIAAHGGGALPYLIAELQRNHSEPIQQKDNLSRLYVDSAVSSAEALQLALAVMGSDNVLFGSDYPIGDLTGIAQRVNMLAAPTRRRVQSANARHIFKL